MTTAHTRTHSLIGFANPYLKCDKCKKRVVYWHDPDRCGCTSEAFNSPCEHELGVISICPSWGPVDGCSCEDKENHDKV
jgi:hypothetical protein